MLNRVAISFTNPAWSLFSFSLWLVVDTNPCCPPLPAYFNAFLPPRVLSTPSRRISVVFGAGVFGMNLLSGWEEKPQAFWSVTGGIYGCIVLSIAGTVALCRRLSLL